MREIAQGGCFLQQRVAISTAPPDLGADCSAPGPGAAECAPAAACSAAGPVSADCATEDASDWREGFLGSGPTHIGRVHTSHTQFMLCARSCGRAVACMRAYRGPAMFVVGTLYQP